MTDAVTQTLRFPPPPSLRSLEALRDEVRTFLGERLSGTPAPLRVQSWNGFDTAFSRDVGARGWIGMTWPKRYGGRERSALERYVVSEEMLAAGAPVGAHWIADRQSGPLLLKYGSEAQKMALLPRIAAGSCCVCIGMSEPDCGSDLAAVRTRAFEVPGGFRVNGSKLWTTHAQRAQYMVLFCRTDGSPADRQRGTSQLLVDLATPGIRIRSLTDISGAEDFNEVSFEDVFVPADAIIGTRGQGWQQVMSELAYERSGPERFLSSFAVLTELLRVARTLPGERAAIAIGRIVAHLAVLRRLSRAVAGMLECGEQSALQAALVKDLGALIEQEIPELARQLVAVQPSVDDPDGFSATVALGLLAAPAYSLRGGTREILRGIIARALGLR